VSQFVAPVMRKQGEVSNYRIRVERANGEVQILPTRLRYKSPENIIEREIEDISYLISQHICDHFRLSNLFDNGSILNDGSYAYRALLAARKMEAKLQTKGNIFGGLRSSSLAFRRAVANLANDASFMGYLWGKAETELNMKPLAILALKMKARSAAGGVESGKTRQRKAATTWWPIATEIAIKYRANFPESTQEKVAAEIENLWPEGMIINGKTINRPVYERLRGFVSALEKRGRLARRRKNGG